MKAINHEGQQIINQAIETRIGNKFRIIDSMRASIKYLEQCKIEMAQESLLKVYELIQGSLSWTVICVKGLKPLVVNELSDCQKYNHLDNMHNNVYKIYEKLFHLASEDYSGKNIYSFLKYRIRKDLLHIYSEILFIDL